MIYGNTRKRNLRHLTSPALVVGLLAATPSLAGQPPAGRTYFTVSVGLEERYGATADCLEFAADTLCTLNGTICGSWERDKQRGKKAGLSFRLTGTFDGVAMEIDGDGRVDSRGARSSLAGTARVRADGTELNYAFAGRQVLSTECPQLVDAFRGPPEPPNDIVGSGRLVSEPRSVSGFDKVSLLDTGRLIIDRDGTEELTITAEDNVMPVIESVFRNGTLHLGIRRGNNLETRVGIEYRLSVRALDGLTLSGSAEVEAAGLDASSLDVDLGGSSEARLAGRARQQTIRLTGSAELLAADLPSGSARVTLDGNSHAVVRVRDRIEGTATGSSLLEYYGDPMVAVETSHSATVRRVGD